MLGRLGLIYGVTATLLVALPRSRGPQSVDSGGGTPRVTWNLLSREGLSLNSAMPTVSVRGVPEVTQFAWQWLAVGAIELVYLALTFGLARLSPSPSARRTRNGGTPTPPRPAPTLPRVCCQPPLLSARHHAGAYTEIGPTTARSDSAVPVTVLPTLAHTPLA